MIKTPLLAGLSLMRISISFDTDALLNGLNETLAPAVDTAELQEPICWDGKEYHAKVAVRLG